MTSTTVHRAPRRAKKMSVASLASVEPRVYSYMRFSSAKQGSGTSIERQTEYAAEWAARHGLTLDTALTMRDEGLSAYKETHVKQGAFGVFLKALEDGHIAHGSVLIVEALDRLSRAAPLTAVVQLAAIIEKGVRVVTLKDDQEYSQESLAREPWKLNNSLSLMTQAHSESAGKGDRIVRGMRARCRSWKPGQNLGGRFPGWLEWDRINETFTVRPESAEAIRAAVELYQGGYGPRRIFDTLVERGFKLFEGFGHQGRFYEVMRNRALIGERVVDVMGETFTMPAYYPAVLTVDEFESMQHGMSGRKMVRVGRRSEVPALFTGLRICSCGHCESSMVAQNMKDKQRDDGTFPDSARRINCGGAQNPTGCREHLSTSVVPIERALMTFCGDQINLDGLRSSEAGAKAVATRIAQAEKRQLTLAQEIDNLVMAVAKGASKNIDKALADREREQEQTAASLIALQREYAALVSTSAATNAKSWRALVAGVESLDYDARMNARRLVAEAFEKIVVYISGRDGSAPEFVDLELVSRQGVYRYLRINRKTGAWVQSHDLDALSDLLAGE